MPKNDLFEARIAKVGLTAHDTHAAIANFICCLRFLHIPGKSEDALVCGAYKIIFWISGVYGSFYCL